MTSISVPCQFLLTLIVPRKGFKYTEFADIFKLSRDTISSVFKTWLYFFYIKFGAPEWRKTLFIRTKDLPKPPKVFDNGYLRKVRIVIDTTSLQVCNSILVIYHSFVLCYNRLKSCVSCFL